MANCGLLLNDGTSFLLLNDGTSFLLLNDSTCASEPGANTGPPPGGGDIGHRGSLYWKRYIEQLRGKKKKKKKKERLLEELDEYLVELRDKIEEAPPQVVEPEWVKDLRRAESFAYNGLVAEFTIKQIELHLAIVKRAVEEMDDEDAILLLSVH